MSELEALVILSSIPYLGPVKIRSLIKMFGSALNALKADSEMLKEMRGFGERISQGFKTWPDAVNWKNDLSLAKKMGVKIIPYFSSEFPQQLLEINDSPLLLYVLGELKKSDQMSLAIVGTRQPSIYGMEMAKQISGDLAEKGFTIVSGLARGIDTAAHTAALQKGRTIAVIGSGLFNIYPHENIKLAESIAVKGAVISEFSMMTPPERQNFPRRNRIVSGLSMGTLLIEAPMKSGAMITMEKTLSQPYKKTFALPGRADNDNFKGNNFLIKNGAKLVENANDICESFKHLTFINNSGTTTSKTTLPQEEQALFEKLPSEEFSIEEILESTQMNITKLNVLLMSLMLKKVVREYPGKIYKKLRQG